MPETQTPPEKPADIQTTPGETPTVTEAIPSKVDAVQVGSASKEDPKYSAETVHTKVASDRATRRPTVSAIAGKPPAVSALDRLICDDAARLPGDDGDILVLDDSTGALTNWALAATTGRVFLRNRQLGDLDAVRTYIRQTTPEALSRVMIAGMDTDPQSGMVRLHRESFALYDFLKAHAFAGSRAIGHLPKSHAALADLAGDFAQYQRENDSVGALLLGGNTKHMTRTFNDTLSCFFASVFGQRGRGKFRCLLATQPTGQRVEVSVGGSGLVGYGGVFSGNQADRGGQLMAEAVAADLQTENLIVLDLGCGNGSVSVNLLGNPERAARIAQLIATDIDLDSLRSAQHNLRKYSQVDTTWDNAASTVPDGHVDIVMLNPPFHQGTSVDFTLVQPLLEAAKRVLAPGGCLYLVHNSHARYRSEVAKRFTRVEQVARDATFTVLRAWV